MTKPWEEEWTQTQWGGVGDASGAPHEWLLGAVRTGEDARDAHKDPELMARTRLASQAPAMARLLLELEWAGDEARYVCPACTRSVRHASDCQLVAVLRAAGVRE